MAEQESTFDWHSLCDKADKDRYKPEDAYEFSNGRKFESTDKQGGSIYE